MKRIFVIAVLLLGWYACRAQDAADSVRFRNPSNWKTVRSGDGISVRKFRTKCRKAETYLFPSPRPSMSWRSIPPFAGSCRYRTKNNAPSAAWFALGMPWPG